MTTETKERALPTKADRVYTLRDELHRVHGQIAALVPRHLTPDRMLSVAMTAITRTPLLLECTTVSIMRAIATGAQLGLDVSGIGGQGHLVPFRNKQGRYEAQFIAGYQGLIDLARRSQAVVAIRAREVYEKDHFNYSEGMFQLLEHKPYMGDDPGKLMGAYAVAHLAAGFAQAEVMSETQLNAVQVSSRAGEKGPWKTHKAQMWRKTAIRRLCKLLPQNPDLARAIQLEDRAEAGEPSEPLPGEDIFFVEGAASTTEELKRRLGVSAGEETISEEEEETEEGPREPGEAR